MAVTVTVTAADDTVRLALGLVQRLTSSRGAGRLLLHGWGHVRRPSRFQLPGLIGVFYFLRYAAQAAVWLRQSGLILALDAAPFGLSLFVAPGLRSVGWGPAAVCLRVLSLW